MLLRGGASLSTLARLWCGRKGRCVTPRTDRDRGQPGRRRNCAANPGRTSRGARRRAEKPIRRARAEVRDARSGQLMFGECSAPAGEAGPRSPRRGDRRRRGPHLPRHPPHLAHPGDYLTRPVTISRQSGFLSRAPERAIEAGWRRVSVATAKERSFGEASPPPTPARRRPVPDRRRDRDHPDLPRSLDLPLFAAIDLLKDDEGTKALRGYFEPYAELAREHGLGFVLESPTWRASPRWAAELGYSNEQLADLNRKAIALMEELRERYESPDAPVVISGCVGPRTTATPRRSSLAPPRHRSTTRPRSAPSPRPRPTWSRRSR